VTDRRHTRPGHAVAPESRDICRHRAGSHTTPGLGRPTTVA
jgi:hypothetical protein